LTDLLIGLAVILVVGALAAPKLLRWRLAAGEASAINSVRLINAAEITYASRYPDRGFACALAELAGRGADADPAARLLDPDLAAGVKNGYRFLIARCDGVPATSYLVTALPVAPNQTGVRAFCSDQTGIIRYTPEGSAGCTPGSLPLE